MFGKPMFKKTTQSILGGVEQLRDELENHAASQDAVAAGKELAAQALYEEAKTLRFDAAQARVAAANLDNTLSEVMYDA